MKKLYLLGILFMIALVITIYDRASFPYRAWWNAVSVLKQGSMQEYTVVQVVDGDTIKIRGNWALDVIRILWIDTPETYTTRTGYKECYWDEASAFATDLLLGKSVRIEYDRTQSRKDKYGRYLAHVWIDGELYQERAIENGYGFHYVYDWPTRYHNILQAAENRARKAHRGVWNACDGERTHVKNTRYDTVEPWVESLEKMPAKQLLELAEEELKRREERSNTSDSE